MKRREFITLSLGGVLIYSLDRKATLLHAAETAVQVPLNFFTAREAQIVAAACDRIFPSDENGPGAREAGVIVYIDRQLAGPYGRDELRYTKGPFIDTDPAFGGYQGKDSPQQIYRAGLELLDPNFVGEPPAKQDELLHAIEKTMFFQMLRDHTLEGMFCDPLHGGNANLVGWQMIGYPGPQMSWRAAIHIHNDGEAFRPRPMGLEEILGMKIKGLEAGRGTPIISDAGPGHSHGTGL
jgi:gluconate 2-dehydrogenase gamma chain